MTYAAHKSIIQLKLNSGAPLERDVFGKIRGKERTYSFHVHGSRVSVTLLVCLLILLETESQTSLAGICSQPRMALNF